MIENLSTDLFKEKIFNYDLHKNWTFHGSLPCLIDFYADWCGPCRQVAPILEQLSLEFQGKINIYKINTETEKELALIFGIQSIPSLLFIPMQSEPQMAVGAIPKDSLRKAICEILKVSLE